MIGTSLVVTREEIPHSGKAVKHFRTLRLPVEDANRIKGRRESHQGLTGSSRTP